MIRFKVDGKKREGKERVEWRKRGLRPIFDLGANGFPKENKLGFVLLGKEMMGSDLSGRTWEILTIELRFPSRRHVGQSGTTKASYVTPCRSTCEAFYQKK